jgi:uncharacterized protein YecE (DUF72 family)
MARPPRGSEWRGVSASGESVVKAGGAAGRPGIDRSGRAGTGIRVGCCGWPVARARYVAELDLVEVQQSFYNLPRLATGQRWRAEVPAGFEFVLKAPQLITHDPTSPTYRRLRRPLSAPERARYGAFRPTPEVHAVWQATLELARALGSALVLFQCPPSFTPTSEHVRHLTRFFETIDRGGLRLAWEPRGDWPPAQVRALCRRLDLIHAVDPFQRASVWGEPAYYRLHGRGGPHYRYSDADLADLRVRVGPGPAWVLFNNTAMWDDARRFRRLVAGGHERNPPGRGEE